MISIWVASVALFFMIFLAVRFIYPNIFYLLRNRLLSFHYVVSILRSLEADDEGEVSDSGSYLMRDLRTYADPGSIEEGLKRVVKVRQLYECLDVSRARSSRDDDAEHSYVCIQEMSLVVKALSERLVPDSRYNRHIVGADDILGLIAGFLEDQEISHEESSVQDYWTENPIGVEQLTEVLAACVFAIAYRVKAQGSGGR